MNLSGLTFTAVVFLHFICPSVHICEMWGYSAFELWTSSGSLSYLEGTLPSRGYYLLELWTSSGSLSGWLYFRTLSFLRGSLTLLWLSFLGSRSHFHLELSMSIFRNRYQPTLVLLAWYSSTFTQLSRVGYYSPYFLSRVFSFTSGLLPSLVHVHRVVQLFTSTYLTSSCDTSLFLKCDDMFYSIFHQIHKIIYPMMYKWTFRG